MPRRGAAGSIITGQISGSNESARAKRGAGEPPEAPRDYLKLEARFPTGPPARDPGAAARRAKRRSAQGGGGREQPSRNQHRRRALRRRRHHRHDAQDDGRHHGRLDGVGGGREQHGGDNGDGVLSLSSIGEDGALWHHDANALRAMHDSDSADGPYQASPAKNQHQKSIGPLMHK